MRSCTPLDFAGRCPRCFLRQEHCLCPTIPRVETRTRFLLIRHVNEAWKSTNTARLAALALPRCELVGYGGKDEVLDERPLLAPGTWLLFPGGSPPAPLEEPPACVVVPDGSWPQARRMVQRVPALRTLRRLSLPPPKVPPARLRRPPHPDGMSTLEAIARTVELLEGEELAQPLDRLHATLVERVLRYTGRHHA